MTQPQRIPERILQVRIGPAGKEGRLWTWPTYIEFDGERATAKSTNKAKIKIWNLTDDSVRWIEQRGQRAQVLAGETTPSEMFLGDISTRKTYTQWEGPDRITTIDAADGQTAYRTSTVSLSYPPGTSRATVLADVVSALGLPILHQSALPALTYQRGWAYCGKTRDALTELLRDDASWSIQQGALLILATDEPIPGNALVINAYSGLTGSPKRTNKGVDFECLLQPAIRPGVSVQLDAIDIKAALRITKVKHACNSSGTEWKTQATGMVRK